MTARQVGYGDEGIKLNDLKSQGDQILGAFFRLKSGVRVGRIKEGKGGKAVVLSHGYSGEAILTRSWVESGGLRV